MSVDPGLICVRDLLVDQHTDGDSGRFAPLEDLPGVYLSQQEFDNYINEIFHGDSGPQGR